MKKPIILLSLLSLVAVSGSISCLAAEAGGQDRSDEVRMVREGEIHVQLGEKSRFLPDMLLSTFYDSENGYYYFYNRMTGYINRFHIDSTVVSPVRIPSPAFPWSMNIVTLDSIYLLDLMNDKAYMADRNGNVSATFRLDRDSDISAGSQGQPYVTPHGLLYSSNTSGKFSLALVDRKSGRVSEKYVRYPEVYKDFYGGLLMRVPYTAYNSGEDLAVIGFPAEDSIHVVDMSTGEETVRYAGSRYSEGRLEPLGEGLRGSANVSSQEELEYFREITSYGNMYYDPWRGVYYRIVEKSTPMPDVELSDKAKRLSVIVLDGDFRVIGESDIAEDALSSFRYSTFVSEAGLNIQIRTGEKELAFVTYSLQKID